MWFYILLLLCKVAASFFCSFFCGDPQGPWRGSELGPAGSQALMDVMQRSCTFNSLEVSAPLPRNTSFDFHTLLCKQVKVRGKIGVLGNRSSSSSRILWLSRHFKQAIYNYIDTETIAFVHPPFSNKFGSNFKSSAYAQYVAHNLHGDLCCLIYVSHFCIQLIISIIRVGSIYVSTISTPVVLFSFFLGGRTIL